MSILTPCCLEGSELKDVPQGRMIKFADVETYQAGPPYQEAKAIIMLLTDAFGLELNNNRVIADKLAEQTEFTVLAPDLFDGSPVSPKKIAPPLTAAEINQTWLSWFQEKLRLLHLVLVFAPWLYYQRPGLKRELMQRLVDGVPNSAKLGLAGYCYGAAPMWLALEDRPERIQACFCAHPSFSNPRNLIDARTKLSVAFAENEPWFSGMEHVQAVLKRRDDPPSEVLIYPNVKHGFAARPIPETRPSFEKALEQAARWFSRHLVA